MKRPTGYIATCQCGSIVGALDLQRCDEETVAHMLGKWVAQGRALSPMFEPHWTAAITGCTCRSDQGDELSLPEYSCAGSPAIVWPKARDVGRLGDMSPSAHLRVGFDADNDIQVSVWDERGGGSVEFCNAGGGGGRSHHTRLALIQLMVAIEADNAERPDLDWWALRTGTAKVAE